MKSIILHICCAPCAIYPLEFLRKEGFHVRGLFFNQNIHPLSEYELRLGAAKGYAGSQDLELWQSPYEPKEFFNAVEENKEAPGRCLICWRLRLKNTAEKAKEIGFDYFTTTLLVSPYQDTLMLETIGEEEAVRAGVKFFKADFKSHFRSAHEQAKKKGIYCQKYCGCLYSKMEREKSKSFKKVNNKLMSNV